MSRVFTPGAERIRFIDFLSFISLVAATVISRLACGLSLRCNVSFRLWKSVR